MNTFSSLGNSIVSINQRIDPDFNNNLYENVGLSFQ